MEHDVQAALSRFRNGLEQHVQAKPEGHEHTFTNPTPENPVAAAVFLSFLAFDAHEVVAALRSMYPYWDHVPSLPRQVCAMLRFTAWMALKGHHCLHCAVKALHLDSEAQRLLDFDHVPTYETFRDFLHVRLAGSGALQRLFDALLRAQQRLHPDLGKEEVQDASPQEAFRDDRQAPYNPHYEVRMHKSEMRWDPVHESLLTQQFYQGVAHESRWLLPFTERVKDAGLRFQGDLTVDNGYVSHKHVARQWRYGQPLRFRWLDEWVVNVEAARDDVLKRYQKHRKHTAFLVEAGLEAKLRFLVDHGSPPDVEAVGRFLRDRELDARVKAVVTLEVPAGDEVAQAVAELSLDDALRAVEVEVGMRRNQNEGLNAEFKRVLRPPRRRGALEMFRRAAWGWVTLHLVQVTRLLNGVTMGLCRTASIL